jgi:MarR family transcriptional regulator for hemolysin
MPRPTGPPIGLTLTNTARTVSRAFDDALAAAGGSLPSWLILISLKTRRLGNQRQLAAAVGIQGATLTHHLNAMEADGLLTRRRDPDNRRVHVVELTEKGEAAFLRLRTVAIAFDQRLRTGITDEEIATLARLLDRLRRNITDPADAENAERHVVPAAGG